MIFEILPFPTPVNPDPPSPPGGACSCSDCTGCDGPVWAAKQQAETSAAKKHDG